MQHLKVCVYVCVSEYVDERDEERVVIEGMEESVRVFISYACTDTLTHIRIHTHSHTHTNQSDILMLCSSNPQRMYKMASYRKHTKNHWARDDPALAVVQIGFLVAVSVAYALAFQVRARACVCVCKSVGGWVNVRSVCSCCVGA
jgi:hypothetical protein